MSYQSIFSNTALCSLIFFKYCFIYSKILLIQNNTQICTDNHRAISYYCKFLTSILLYKYRTLINSFQAWYPGLVRKRRVNMFSSERRCSFALSDCRARQIVKSVRWETKEEMNRCIPNSRVVLRNEFTLEGRLKKQ